jgi:ribosome-associated protein
MRLEKLVKTAVDALEDIKGRDIIVIDVRKITSLFDKIIVATGESTRQTKSMAKSVHQKVKEQGGTVYGVEGEQMGEWVLVDLGAVVVHIMQPTIRSHYNLEELWTPAKAPRRRAAKTAAE